MDQEKYLFKCLDGREYYKSDIYPNKCTQIGNDLYCILTISKSMYPNAYRNTWSILNQEEVGRDILIKITPSERTDVMVYDTGNNKTRIVGLRYPNVYLLNRDKIYEVPIIDLKRNKSIKFEQYINVASLPVKSDVSHEVYYQFDWENNELYIIYSPAVEDNYTVTHVKVQK